MYYNLNLDCNHEQPINIKIFNITFTIKKSGSNSFTDLPLYTNDGNTSNSSLGSLTYNTFLLLEF